MARCEPPVFVVVCRQATWPLLDWCEAQTRDCGYGRREDLRHLIASTNVTAYLDWPGVAQVFRLERTWREHGHTKRALHHGITSLRPAVGSPERLLALTRGHWAIEHGRHRVKDVALGEDHCPIHRGQGPTVMALLRDAALSLLHQAGIRQISAVCATIVNIRRPPSPCSWPPLLLTYSRISPAQIM